MALRRVPKVTVLCRKDPANPLVPRPVLEMMKQNTFRWGRGTSGADHWRSRFCFSVALKTRGLYMRMGGPRIMAGQ